MTSNKGVDNKHYIKNKTKILGTVFEVAGPKITDDFCWIKWSDV